MKLSVPSPAKERLSSPSKRPYQSEAIKSLTYFVKTLIQNVEINGSGYFDTASLLEMATGSGKTFTVGKYIEKLIVTRNRHDVLERSFGSLKVILLSNRIDGVSQFRDDLIYGRSGKDEKPPILSEEVRNNIKTSTYHSRADGEDLNDREVIEIENDSGEDEFIFSTWQTANEKELASRLTYVDIIIIDEAHNVRPNSDFFHVIQSLSKRGRNGGSPLILPITATPTDVTKELFGDSVFTFGIGEYLASGYAPNVEYHVITGVHGTAEEVKELVSMIRRAKEEQDFEIKEVLVKEARELFDVLIAQDVGIESFAGDIIDRLKEKKVDGTEEMKETIIFARSIHDADMIAREMNGKVGIQGFALAYHSQNDDNNALSRLTDPHNPCRVIVAVDKLNESIDLPVVRNIVFYRYTQDPKIYLQQFGRGLRGNGVVRYYDYIGGIENFSWIGQIQEKYSASIKVQGNNLGDPNTSFVIHTSLPGIENTIDEQEENPSQYPIMDMRDGDRITIEIEKPKAIFADHTIPINSEDIDPITPNAEKLPSVPTFYDTPINILDNVQNSGKRTENTEDPRVEKQNHFSGTSYFVNLADLGLMVHNLTCEVKEQLDVSDEDLRDFFLNISGVGKEGAYERWKESYTQLICYISFKKLKTMTVNGVPLRRIFLNKNIKSKRDLGTILMVYFSEYLELEKGYTQARYNNQKTMEKEQEKLNEEREKNQKEFIYALWLEIQKAIPDLESIKCANFEWVNTMNQWNTKQQATKKVGYEVDHLGKRVPTFMKRMDFYRFFYWIRIKAQEYKQSL